MRATRGAWARIGASALAATLAAALAAPTAAQDGASTPASADATRARDEADALRRLAEVRARLAALAEEQRGIEAERDAAAADLREADATVAAAVRALRDTESAIATGERELASLEAEQAALEASLSTQREALAELVRAAYALGRHEQLKLLLAQDRVADLSRVLAYQGYLQRDRSARIEGLLAELQALAEVGARVQAQREGLAVRRDEQAGGIAALEAGRAERRALLEDLERQGRDAEARRGALARDERALESLLERLRDVLADIPDQPEEARAFATRRGALPWPLDGAVVAGFGGTLPDGRRSSGLLLAGTAGAEVRVVSPGRVAFAEWLNGYGLLLIVDHGDGWMSLYAHNDALLKDAGDWVRAGEPVATVGSSGGQGRAALYFELRQGARPVDPRPWLQRR